MCNRSIKRCTAMISIASVGGETGECDEGVSRGSFKSAGHVWLHRADSGYTAFDYITL